MFTNKINFVIGIILIIDIGVSGANATDGNSILWDGTVNLKDKVIISQGEKLIINPGTTVLISGGQSTYIEVRGELVVDGTDERLINFIPQSPGYWGGIRFLSNAKGTIRYCIINEGRDSAIYCNESSPIIEYNIIINSLIGKYNGIVCENGAAPVIENNKIISNGERDARAAILVLDAKPIIRNNTFEHYMVSIQIGRASQNIPEIISNSLISGYIGIVSEATSEGMQQDLSLSKTLEHSDLKFITSMHVNNNENKRYVDITTWSGVYRIEYSDGEYKLVTLSNEINKDKCNQGEIKGLTPIGHFKYGEAKYKVLCIPTVLSQLGRTGCKDTPEDIIIIFDKTVNSEPRWVKDALIKRSEVSWISDAPGRGKFYVISADLNEDDIDELIVAQNGWCDQTGKIVLYSIQK